MKVINFSEVRNSFRHILNNLSGLMETVHLLKSPANAAHLARSIAQFQSGKTTERELLDE